MNFTNDIMNCSTNFFIFDMERGLQMDKNNTLVKDVKSSEKLSFYKSSSMKISMGSCSNQALSQTWGCCQGCCY